MTEMSKFPERRLAGRHGVIRPASLVHMLLVAFAAGCTQSDPRLDDSDVFGSPSPSSSNAAPAASPS